ncbi:MAG: lysylphosphatidylglycerol synthase domain-containing protein [Candidatus Binatia bacterium]
MRAPNGNPVRSLAYPGLAAGVALFTGLLAYHGLREVGAALATAGSGLIVVTLFHVVPMTIDALGWRRLLRGRHCPDGRTILLARWVGESVNGLLPVMQLGGNIAKARLLTRRGVPGPTAGASAVVDVTLVVLSQMLFTGIGFALLVLQWRGGRLALPVAAGTAVMGTLLAAFFAIQRHGLFGVLSRALARVARGSDLAALTSGAAALDAEVTALYEDGRAIAAAVLWHLASWIVGAGEVWLALAFLGHPVDLRTAVLVESLGQAVRASAFVVPGALGVQESGYLMLGRAIGVDPETAFALALAKRVRELLMGLPGLLAWQLDGAVEA